MSKFKRAHLRAPIKEDVLYVDDEYAFKARTMNISEGGVLLENLPHMPEIRSIPLMIPVPHFPILSSLSTEKIMGLKHDHLQTTILRMRARMVRSFEGESDVDKIFVTKIGCEFIKPEPEKIQIIADYVEIIAKNVVYLLGLFEDTERKGGVELLRHVAGLLGYKQDEKLTILRSKVLHDYQSLESL